MAKKQTDTQKFGQQYLHGGWTGVNMPDPLNIWGGKDDAQMTVAMPNDPGYDAVYDPNTMGMVDWLNQNYGDYDEGFNQFRDEALRKGPSAWLNLTRNYGDLQEQDQRERGAHQVASQTAKARDDLAAMGGMSSGARERVAEQGSKNYLNMSQELTRQGNINDLQSGIQDESNRMTQLAQLPGMEMTRLKEWEGARQADIQNTMAEKDRVNQYNMNLYNRQMELWAADRQATATENSGKK